MDSIVKYDAVLHSNKLWHYQPIKMVLMEFVKAVLPISG